MSRSTGAPGKSGKRAAPSPRPNVPARPVPTARAVALAALAAVDGGAFANLTLPQLLVRAKREGLADRDAALATELVYGTVRMQRELDAVLAPFISRTPDTEVRRVLRMGAYQIRHLRIPAHAAVSETVEIAPGRGQGFVNAVLRQLAGAKSPPTFANLGEELSYPDWIIDAAINALGRDDAIDALGAMNVPATSHEREDGYVQDLASQSVGSFVGALPGERILDLCAAPGGKATSMAGRGAYVVAVELHAHRAKLVVENVERLGLKARVATIRADGRSLPFPSASFDRVLVDAPCSGLGSLRRRPDARWRITPTDVDALVVLQHELLSAAVSAVRPGGTVVFSACTFMRKETEGLDAWAAKHLSGLVALEPPTDTGWRPCGRGALLLPGATDGMFVVAYQRAEDQ